MHLSACLLCFKSLANVSQIIAVTLVICDEQSLLSSTAWIRSCMTVKTKSKLHCSSTISYSKWQICWAPQILLSLSWLSTFFKKLNLKEIFFTGVYLLWQFYKIAFLFIFIESGMLIMRFLVIFAVMCQFWELHRPSLSNELKIMLNLIGSI